MAPLLAAAQPCALPDLPSGTNGAATIASVPAPTSDAISTVNIFFDGSGSMAGYASSKTPSSLAGRAYVDLVTAIAHRLSLGFRANVRAHRFGQKIQPLAENDLPKLAQEATYLCQGCDINESRIDAVLELAVKAKVDELFVIVTDLFLTEQHLLGSGTGSLLTPLATILRNGRAIGLLGIRSGFKGKIHDLPSKKIYEGASERPFYALAIGTPAAVLRLHRQLATDYLSNLPDETHRFVLFTTQIVRQPIQGAAWPREAFTLGDGARPATLLRSQHSEELQQLSLDPQFAPPKAVIAISDHLTPHSLMPRELQHRQQAWLLLDPGSFSTCPVWLPMDDRPSLLSLSPGNGTIGLRFASPPALQGFPRQRAYLFRFEVLVSRIDIDAAAIDWLRDWSFEAKDEAALLARKPAFFPTLNLSRLAATMKTVIQDEFKPQPLLRFGIIAQFR